RRQQPRQQGREGPAARECAAVPPQQVPRESVVQARRSMAMARGAKHHYMGEVSQQEKRACFLTVHDLGTNHHSFLDFVNHPCMQEIKDRSIFVHVDMPGHHDNADNLPDGFRNDSYSHILKEEGQGAIEMLLAAPIAQHFVVSYATAPSIGSAVHLWSQTVEGALA
ncbi:hypothetical protein FOCC_FOCC000957, partial [Frankliniella occidentalis]